VGAFEVVELTSEGMAVGEPGLHGGTHPPGLTAAMWTAACPRAIASPECSRVAA
jgi:hypothetical protein